MTRRLTVLSQSCVGIVVVGLQTSSGGQDEVRGVVPHRSRGAEAVLLAESAPLVLAGCVVGPDGTPVEGTRVASSAGGEARSDARGEFRLEACIPLDAGSLQVTAVGPATGASLRASAQVQVQGSNPAYSGPLVLELAGACQPSWEPTFGGQPGTGGFRVDCLTAFDDGSGPAFYVGGSFPSVGGVEAANIARWDGSSWSALPSGLNGSVSALVEFDDGSGPALYAGGQFHSGGGPQPNHVAKWNGSSWLPLGSPANGTNGFVYALAAFDDGSGPALYVGGSFNAVAGMTMNGIARWNGSTWSALGSGMLSVRALMVYDDGSGPALYAGGIFSTAGGVPASRIARWDGSSWSALGTGMNSSVRALVVFDDGGGPALYAGGRLTGAGGVATPRIGKWDGASWSALGDGLSLGDVYALAVLDDGGGPALHAAGSFASAGGLVVNRIARWDGSSWTALGGGLNGVASALSVFDDGGGPALYVGGLFTEADGVLVNYIARWDGASWSALGAGMSNGVGGTSVDALAVFDDGGGPALYAGGEFRYAGGVAATRIAKWRDGAWSPLIGPGSGVNGTVHALTVFDHGGGPALYAGGLFLRGGGVDLNRIGKWDGTSWSALGSGMSDDVRTLAGFDDGSGPALFAGGEFLTAGGVAAKRIARWDGASWSALGSGIGRSSSGPDVSALVVFDDGCGPSLYVGGAFETVADSHDSFLARWRGRDTNPPVLSCPAEVLVVDDRDDAPGAVVDFLVTASDGCQPDPPVICVPPSGSFFPRGTTTVICAATDAEGNQASCSFPVVVSLPPRARVR